jgi:hypothetical protein
MNYIIFVRTPIIEILDPPLSPAANNTSRIIADMFTQLDRLKALLKAEERERLAAVHLQAAGRELLARRRAQSLHEEKCLAVISRAIMCPSSEEQAAVRLQAAGRGFLAWRMVRSACCSVRRCSKSQPARSTTQSRLYFMRLPLKYRSGYADSLRGKGRLSHSFWNLP